MGLKLEWYMWDSTGLSHLSHVSVGWDGHMGFELEWYMWYSIGLSHLSHMGLGTVGQYRHMGLKREWNTCDSTGQYTRDSIGQSIYPIWDTMMGRTMGFKGDWYTVDIPMCTKDCDGKLGHE